MGRRGGCRWGEGGGCRWEEGGGSRWGDEGVVGVMMWSDKIK